METISYYSCCFSDLLRLRTEADNEVRQRYVQLSLSTVPGEHVNAWCGGKGRGGGNQKRPWTRFAFKWNVVRQGMGFLAAADPSRVSGIWMQFPALCIWIAFSSTWCTWEVFIQERDVDVWTQSSLQAHTKVISFYGCVMCKLNTKSDK